MTPLLSVEKMMRTTDLNHCWFGFYFRRRRTRQADFYFGRSIFPLPPPGSSTPPASLRSTPSASPSACCRTRPGSPSPCGSSPTRTSSPRWGWCWTVSSATANTAPPQDSSSMAEQQRELIASCFPLLSSSDEETPGVLQSGLQRGGAGADL